MGPTTVAVIAALLAPAALAPAPTNAAPSAPVASSSVVEVPMRGRVLGVAVAPASAGADIVLAIDSSVTLKHFTLDSPSRIVIDLGGATLAIRSNYDGKARGPVRNLRLSQYRADTVRLVIDLDGSRSYTVVREGGQVRIALRAPAVAFARWGSTNTAGEPSPQVSAGRLEQQAPIAATSFDASSVDVSSVDAKPVDVKPVDVKPVDAKLVDATPAEVPQVETPIVKAGPQPVVRDDHSGDPLTAACQRRCRRWRPRAGSSRSRASRSATMVRTFAT